MIKHKFLIKIVLIFFFLFLGLYSNAYAYLDPGSISYVFTLIIAGLASASYMIKLYWQNLKNFFSKLINKKKDGKEQLTNKKLQKDEKKIDEN
jgi:hypothetical protein